MSPTVHFANGPVRFEGTLTIPAGPGPHPAAVLISGGNPVDRDCDIGGFKPFRLLADHLAGSGIATLRYDDRGVGGSTGGPFWDSVLEDHERDVLAAVALLAGSTEIDASRIGLIGHSWGGAVAAKVAAGSDRIAFIVTLGAEGVTGDKVMLEVRRTALAGRPEEEVEEGLRLQQRLHEESRAGGGFEALEAEIRKRVRAEYEALPDDARLDSPAFDDYLNASVDGFLLSAAKTPFFRFLLDYDPLPALERVRCPVLLLFGEDDPYAAPETNRDRMLGALTRGGNRDCGAVIIPGTDHFFRDEHLSSTAFAPGFLDRLTSWITARCAPVP